MRSGLYCRSVLSIDWVVCLHTPLIIHTWEGYGRTRTLEFILSLFCHISSISIHAAAVAAAAAAADDDDDYEH